MTTAGVDKIPTRDEDVTGVVLNWNTEPTAVHANLILVRRTQSDVFAMVFGDAVNLPGRLVEENGANVLLAPIVSSLRVPVSSMGAFVGAMTQAWNEYVKSLPPGERRNASPVYEPAPAPPSKNADGK